eukprot:TRINITY_DN5858_c0_g1_i6.p4 TRINITY_DN5858_c0_g1~~TRINITY_DN5858_c0_g1_i6.p4  ORF type:complete len:105 (-),score=0.87 TRINITY_DN5858_c0_g1_i6:1397-1711(-)
MQKLVDKNLKSYKIRLQGNDTYPFQHPSPYIDSFWADSKNTYFWNAILYISIQPPSQVMMLKQDGRLNGKLKTKYIIQITRELKKNNICTMFFKDSSEFSFRKN